MRMTRMIRRRIQILGPMSSSFLMMIIKFIMQMRRMVVMMKRLIGRLPTQKWISGQRCFRHVWSISPFHGRGHSTKYGHHTTSGQHLHLKAATFIIETALFDREDNLACGLLLDSQLKTDSYQKHTILEIICVTLKQAPYMEELGFPSA